VRVLLNLLYPGVSQRMTAANRNHIIRQRFADGEGLSDLAREYGISPQRVYQIVHNRNR
jgi:Mor family transcriptional regulator